MSETDKRKEQSIRLFEALGNVDPELLIRSEKKKRRPAIMQFAGMAAACLALIFVGGLSLYTLHFTKNAEKSESQALPYHIGITNECAYDEGWALHGEPITESAAETVTEEALQPSQTGGLTDSVGSGKDVEDEKGSKETQSEGVSQESAQVSNKNALDQNTAQTENGESERVVKMLEEVYARIAPEDEQAMGILTRYLPADLPEGYQICDVSARVGEEEGDCLIITLEAQNGDTLTYCASQREKQQEAWEQYILSAREWSQTKQEMILPDQAYLPDGEYAITVQYQSGVCVEVRGNGSEELVWEMIPEE